MKKNYYEEIILNCLEDLAKIKKNEKKLINEMKLAEIDSAKLTSSNYTKLNTELLKMQIMHFERFAKLVVELRNIGSKKRGFQKRHLLSEFETYKEIKKKLG
jgi:hypothetical protein